jgi:hypothetical protein
MQLIKTSRLCAYTTVRHRFRWMPRIHFAPFWVVDDDQVHEARAYELYVMWMGRGIAVHVIGKKRLLASWVKDELSKDTAL